MKTVMKKICCLLLVAVLMVGYLPFQAFAEGSETITISFQDFSTTITLPYDGTAPVYVTDTSDISAEIAGKNVIGWKYNGSTVSVTSIGFTESATLEPVYGCDGTVNCKATSGHSDDCKSLDCPVSGCEYNNGHDGLHSNQCSECKDIGGHLNTCSVWCDKTVDCTATNHKEGCLSLIVCGNCGEKGHEASECDKLFCPDCGAALATGVHLSSCIQNCTRERDCTSQTHYEDCKHALCDLEGCTLNEGHTGEHTGVPCDDPNCRLYLGHAGKHSYLCQTVGCNLPINHEGNCSNDPAYKAGNSKLTVNVNYYTGSTKTHTEWLTTYEGLSSDTLVYDFLAARKDQINAKLGDYWWSGNVYDHTNKRVPESMKATVGNGRTVYINAYVEADYVYIYVHNSRSHANIRVIQMDGKQTGDSINYSEVKSAVGKYYNLSSMTMYEKDQWDLYVKNKTAQSTKTLKAEEGITEVHVRISGSAKSTSTSTADSSNYKTGDMIFMPAFILVASAGALAAVLYLKKKQAVR